MEAFSLLMAAIALLAFGCASAVLSLRVFPLQIRVQGQPHGRFAGLSGASQADSSDRGVKRRIDALTPPFGKQLAAASAAA